MKKYGMGFRRPVNAVVTCFYVMCDNTSTLRHWCAVFDLFRRLLQHKAVLIVVASVVCHADCKSASAYMQISEGVEVVAAAQCRRKQFRSGVELVCSFGEKNWWRVGGAYAIELPALSASGHEDA